MSELLLALYLAGMFIWQFLAPGRQIGLVSLTLAVWAGAAALEAVAIRGRLPRLRMSPLVLLAGIQAALLWAATSGVKLTGYAWPGEKAAVFTGAALAPMLVIDLVYRGRVQVIRRLCFGLIALALVLAGIALYALLTVGRSPYGYLVIYQLNQIWLSRILAMGMIAAAGFALSRSVRGWPAWAAVALGLLAVQVALGSRGPLLAGLIGLAATAWIATARAGSRLRWAWLAGVGAVCLVAVLFLAAGRLSPTYLQTDWNAWSRGQLWSAAWGRFLAEPWTGGGTGSFLRWVPPVLFRYPHNLPLELAAENGLPGLLVFLATVTLALGQVRRAAHLGRGQVGALAAILAGELVLFFGAALFSGDINSNNTIWIMAALGGALPQTILPEAGGLSSPAEPPSLPDRNHHPAG